MKTPIVLISLFLLLATSAYCQQLKKEKLDSLLVLLEENQKFMGSLSLAKNGQIIYSRAVGFQDVERNKKATLNTIYKVGSITKMFTATLIFKAVEAGKISLNDKLGQFFPSIPNADQISIEQMLGHKSGIFSITSHRDYHEWKGMEISKTDMITKTSQSQPVFEPGAESRYSNSNYILLTYILEEIYNAPYQNILENEIVKPLQLSKTYADEVSDPKQPGSHSYRFLGAWEKIPPTHPTVSLGAGFIQSTPMDLINFQESLLGGKLIHKESLAKMMSFENGMGYGLFEFDYSDKNSVGHTGSIDGFNAFLAYLPEDRISVAMTSNGMNFSQNEVVQQIFNTLYDHDAPLPIISDLKIEDSALENLSGSYATEKAAVKIRVSHKNGYLIAQAGGQDAFILEAESPKVFKHAKAGIVLEFEPEVAQMTLKQGGREMEFTKD